MWREPTNAKKELSNQRLICTALPGVHFKMQNLQEPLVLTRFAEANATACAIDSRAFRRPVIAASAGNHGKGLSGRAALRPRGARGGAAPRPRRQNSRMSRARGRR